ncbi:RrF2 family transcriptional regulator [Glaciimonas immobilis]|uniref:Rrf2 family nitric oxide-sensitive transcriptional repressor n=1 Tax=Glaciimonas immobilis TaxID=728004 RepID=A0A840RLD6_9BURK|nr:Rrf2 family transcriptional regulator [Glaciimonas immobilis]KAF3999029.1 Rrf2 family transcriptional regulator [Glaciimonas immobilis]MBB5198455.1 Rrf2 family nitric oxide-sensitive transcriptional repressor [Glaciimonas immobilis]
MQLTKFTDFGLRVLMYLAAMPAREIVTVGELAQRFDIPKNHLNKVVNRMVKQGWILATPGRNGGVRMARAPETLHLGDILNVMEGHTQLVDCSQPLCILKGNCYLKRVLDNGQREFYTNMNRYSLAELVQPATAGPETAAIIARMHFQPTMAQ